MALDLPRRYNYEELELNLELTGSSTSQSCWDGLGTPFDPLTAAFAHISLICPQTVAALQTKSLLASRIGKHHLWSGGHPR
jgi:hypothetical protein